MSFKAVETELHTKEYALNRVSVGYRRPPQNGKRGTEKVFEVKPRLKIGVPRTIAGRFDPTQRYDLLFGTGPDAGKTRVAVAVNGCGRYGRAGLGGGVFKFGYVPALSMDAAEKEFVDFLVLDPAQHDGAVLELFGPAWLRDADR